MVILRCPKIMTTLAALIVSSLAMSDSSLAAESSKNPVQEEFLETVNKFVHLAQVGNYKEVEEITGGDWHCGAATSSSGPWKMCFGAIVWHGQKRNLMVIDSSQATIGQGDGTLTLSPPPEAGCITVQDLEKLYGPPEKEHVFSQTTKTGPVWNSDWTLDDVKVGRFLEVATDSKNCITGFYIFQKRVHSND